MNREEALKLVRERIANPALVGHSLAVAAVMRALARRLGEDAGRWELAGLLHDIDYEETGGDPLRHGLAAGEMLSGMGMDAETVHAVMAHNQANGTVRETLMDRALYAADPVTGLITACALVRPDRSSPASKDRRSGRNSRTKLSPGRRREQIDACAALGLDRSEFIELSLAAMKEIAGELEL
jgi:putative nucleotidyltransferase with HDIG domain